MNLKNLILTLVSILSLNFALAGDFKTIEEAEFKQLLKTGKYTLIDVRTPQELDATGIISGAINIDFLAENFDSKISELDKSKDYIIYCRSGRRSANASSKMVDIGLKALNLAGGMNGWLANNNPTVKK